MKPFGYYNYYYNKSLLIRFFGLLIGEIHFGYWVRFNHIRDFLKNKRKNEKYTILDVGTAQGQTCIWLSEYFSNSKICSIEINPIRVAIVDKLIKEVNLENIVITNNDILKLDSSEKFQIIICSDVLEHIPEWQNAVQKMIDVLDIGGEIFIHVPSNHIEFQSNNLGFRKYLNLGDYNESKTEIGEAHFQDGIALTDFEFLDVNPDIAYTIKYTFSKWTMKLHTLFEYFKVKSPRFLYLLIPILRLLTFENKLKISKGGGIKVVIKKT